MFWYTYTIFMEDTMLIFLKKIKRYYEAATYRLFGLTKEPINDSFTVVFDPVSITCNM